VLQYNKSRCQTVSRVVDYVEYHDVYAHDGIVLYLTCFRVSLSYSCIHAVYEGGFEGNSIWVLQYY